MVRVSVSAQSANLGPGFDCLALALNIRNEFCISPADGFHYSCNGYDSDGELLVRALVKGAELCGTHLSGARVRAVNQIAPKKGLGSSATAVVAGLIGGILLSGGKVCLHEVLQVASKIEGHADNAAAAIYGGCVAVMDRQGEITAVKLPISDLWRCVVCIPEIGCDTQLARGLMPAEVDLADAVGNLSRVAVLVTGLAAGDESLLVGVDHDRIHQPYRANDAMADALVTARSVGARFAVVSGSGPSVMALTTGDGASIGKAMVAAFGRWGIESEFDVVQVCGNGVSWQIGRDDDEGSVAGVGYSWTGSV